ncbi:hypothetical protein DT019_38230 [Streptomyces sp. SDr-06]|uniref:hypothetical protein n=1 Tax=Streptomyces sp. SDr-06 TaxID=2267702 RepID=UPI000DEA3986|nr:hypothetical protein [Streptomyces sp. SDr-06]RCH59671.1 hypothetical protein DT019_38230 [Streptomyces sp. SDr-06]
MEPPVVAALVTSSVTSVVAAVAAGVSLYSVRSSRRTAIDLARRSAQDTAYAEFTAECRTFVIRVGPACEACALLDKNSRRTGPGRFGDHYDQRRIEELRAVIRPLLDFDEVQRTASVVQLAGPHHLSERAGAIVQQAIELTGLLRSAGSPYTSWEGITSQADVERRLDEYRWDDCTRDEDGRLVVDQYRSYAARAELKRAVDEFTEAARSYLDDFT